MQRKGIPSGIESIAGSRLLGVNASHVDLHTQRVQILQESEQRMTPNQKKQWRRIIARIGLAIVFCVGVVLLLLWLGGFFHKKIDTNPPLQSTSTDQTPRVVEAHFITVAQEEIAIGTVVPVRQSDIASRILSRVVSVPIQAGEHVSTGDQLIELDDTDLRQRIEQNEAQISAEVSAVDQASEEFRRASLAFDQRAASALEVISTKNTLDAAKARLEQAQRRRDESETILGYAKITAPFDGIVIEKHVQIGDTVIPGQKLLTMYDPTQMQLVANVRESLTSRLRVGDEVKAQIESINLTCNATVSEIVPQASTQSRSFEVKVIGPCPEGVYPGMYGKLHIPLNDEKLLVIPALTIHHVGQLTLVRVFDGQSILTRSVRLGRHIGDNVEVLAGLKEGERVVLDEEPKP